MSTKTHTQSPFKTGCTAVALAFAASSVIADPLHASFERMLAVEPASARPPAVPIGPADPLIAALVVPLRDGASPVATNRPSDPVLESFTRMLAHEPNWATPALPQAAGADPLIAAVVWPLLRSKHITIASAATPVPR